jgi:hypothetical protein
VARGGSSSQQPPRSEQRRHGVAETLAAEAIVALPWQYSSAFAASLSPEADARRGHRGSPIGGARLVVLVPLTKRHKVVGDLPGSAVSAGPAGGCSRGSHTSSSGSTRSSAQSPIDL